MEHAINNPENHTIPRDGLIGIMPCNCGKGGFTPYIFTDKGACAPETVCCFATEQEALEAAAALLESVHGTCVRIFAPTQGTN